MFFPYSLDQPTYMYSQWSKYIHNVCEKSCIWVPHPFCQKCHIISLSQQLIKVFILYDRSHNDFKCFYYSARGRQTLFVCTMPVQLHSRFQLSKPGRAWTGYSDWPHWNTVNCMHYVPSDLQSTKKFCTIHVAWLRDKYVFCNFRVLWSY